MALQLQHAVEHVDARCLDIRRGRLGVETGCLAQAGVIDHQAIKRHDQVGASQSQRDIALHAAAGYHMIMSQARQRAATTHLDRHQRALGLDAIDSLTA